MISSLLSVLTLAGGEIKDDVISVSDWSLYTDMEKLIISQLDHSIPLIIFNSCLSLAELAGCGPLSLRSVKALLMALL